jgi:NADPH:quinone reductase-like Zn-dependent oxidoreductase
MKAIVFHEYGGVDKLKFEDVPEPKAGFSDALVKVKAVALNHLDIWERLGGVPLPHISGSDIAGEVAELTGDPKNFRLGDRVMVFPALSCNICEPCIVGRPTQCDNRQIIGYQIDGGYAEYLRVPIDNLFKIPSNLSFEEAAALPLAASTAWNMLVRKGKVNPNSKVLIHGASSGVSTYAIQLVKIFGAEVISTTSSNDKIEKVIRLGADRVINYLEEDIVLEVLKFTDNKGVDLVIDHVGSATFNSGLKSLRRGGKLVSAGVTTGNIVEIDIKQIYRNELIVEGSYIFTKGDFLNVLKLAEDNRLRIVISDKFPLEEAAKAQTFMEEGKHFGKIVLDV